MAKTKTEGISILDGLVADTMSQVESKPKRELTALAGETGPKDPLPATPALFPHDRPSEAVGVAIAEINRAIGELEKTRDALQLLAGDPNISLIETKRREETERKLAEREADRKASSKREAVAEAMADANGDFAERFSALQKEAQDATFGTSENAPSTWTCPDHLAAEPKTSPRGRKFNRCPVEGCGQFEK